MPGPARFYHVLSDPNADPNADTDHEADTDTDHEADTDTDHEADTDTVEVADDHAVSFRLWLFDGHHEPEQRPEPDPGITLAV
jgi:hypothetical protein